MQKKTKHILVIRFSSIGDIVLTSPIVRALKFRFPEAKIFFLTQEKFVDLVKANPNIDQVIAYKNNFWITLFALKKIHFDIIIDAHFKLRSLLITLFFPFTSVYRYSKLNFEKWLAVQWKKNRLPDIHLVDRYFNALAPLNIKNDGLGLDFFIAPETSMTSQSILSMLPEKYIVGAIGAQYNTKKMLLSQWDLLLKKINVPVVLIGGAPEEKDALQLAKGKNSTINLCNKTTLQQSAFLIKHAQLVIAHDSGMMHIAAAFKKPLLSIWGNTIPEFGMFPYFGQQQVVEYRAEVKGLTCRPCSKIGFSSCPQQHFACMNKQGLEAMIQFINAQIEAIQPMV